MVEWKEIPGLEGRYEASNTGLIRNAWRGNVLKPFNIKGYDSVCTWDSERYKHKRHGVHRLVAAAFLGPSEMQIRHLDGNPLNNKICNLAYGTAKENSMDRHKHGTTVRGEKHYKAVFTNDQILEIRKMYSDGIRQADIARLMGLYRPRVHEIVRMITWKHI